MPQEILHIKSIKEHHRMIGLGGLKHPLIRIMKFEEFPPINIREKVKFTLGFYTIVLKKNYECKTQYGQTTYDFDEGLMGFFAPNQVTGVDDTFIPPKEGWLLMVQPDFFNGYSIAKKIKEYGFFDYSVHEALILSEDEEKTIEEIFKNLYKEYLLPIDKFSQEVMIAQIELLLTFCNRYYNRQFITRKIPNAQLLPRVETVLNEYFSGDYIAKNEMITVSQLSAQLSVSPQYLSDMLRQLTGQSAQQHIHAKLIEKAKELLTTTNFSVGEVAYQLGFHYPQSFSKLFKSKTSLSPLEFRASFN
jgi:AraC-like DNA-binding protein